MKTLHTSSHYMAALHDTAGLVVQRKNGTGVVMELNHPQYAEYVDAIKTAINAAEADALCRALLN